MLISKSSLSQLSQHAPKEEEAQSLHYLCQHILVELSEVVGIKKVRNPAHPKQLIAGSGWEAGPLTL